MITAIGSQDMSNYVLKSKYSKYLPEKKRRENWIEITERVFGMHQTKFKELLENNEDLREEFEFAKKMFKEKRVFGSQRALQYAPGPILSHASRIFNCCATYIDRPKVFGEIFYMLLSGCGVGFSIQNKHIDRLPKISKYTSSQRYKTYTYVIEDSIEGWAGAVDALFNSYFNEDNKLDFPVFDYGLIRPNGAYITGGFKAPGPESLYKTIEIIKDKLDKIIEKDGSRKLSSLECHDIVCHIADAVISGGIRRCWAKGSMVYTKNGLKPIETVNVGDEVITSDGTYKKVTNTFDQGKQDTLKVITEDGEFYATPNHRMAVYKNLYEYEWKEIKDLTNDDLLVSLRREIEGTKTELPSFTYNKPFRSTTSKDIIIPELTEDIAWWLGELCGDGYIKLINSNDYTGGLVSCAFHISQMEQAKKFANLYKLFGLENISIYINETENCIRVNKKSNQLALYLSSWLKQPKTIIRIPSCILKANKSIKLAFIGGVMDADGSVSTGKHQHICSTIYYEFAKDLQNLMYSCGLSTRLKEHIRSKKDRLLHPTWKKIYKLYIITNDSKKFIHDIPNLYKKPNVTGYEKKCESFPIKWAKSSQSSYIKSTYGNNSIKNITHSQLVKHDENYNEKIAPVKVIRIEPYKNIETYDIEVEDKHEFFCEGYLSHNSALISLFDKTDNEMINSKLEPYWWDNNPQRMRANNSVILKRNETNKKEFELIFDKIKSFGEPGFVFVDDIDVLTNPCSEISLVPMTYDNDGNHIESGFACCNLSEIIGSKCKTEEDFYNACRAASFLGTLQAAYTDFKYLSPASKEIADRDALIGVSITGMMDAPDLLFDPKVQKKGASIVKETNEKISKLIGINVAKRTTCVKPSGTSSIIGLTSSGIHPHHSRRYIRRVQALNNEFCFNYFKNVNPHAVEVSTVASRDNNTSAILFPCEVKQGSITKNQISAIEFLEKIKITQNNWIKFGVNKNIENNNIQHNISNTILVKPDEWEGVKDFIYDNKASFGGISLLASSGDLDYIQAPFTTIFTPSQIVTKYGDGSVMASGVICSALEAFNDDLWSACSDVLYDKDYTEDYNNFLKNHTNNIMIEDDISEDEAIKKATRLANNMFEPKIKWIAQAKQFAFRYFENNIKEMCYCLKTVHCWKMWCDLNRNWTQVNWDNAIEDSEVQVNINELAAQSCQGGKCEII